MSINVCVLKTNIQVQEVIFNLLLAKMLRGKGQKAQPMLREIYPLV